MREKRENSDIELTKVKKLPTDATVSNNYGSTSLDMSGESSDAHKNFHGINTKSLEVESVNTDDVQELDDYKNTDCFGRERKEKTPIIGAAELFKFSTTFDKILMLIGTIGAMGQGVAIPANLATFGDVVDVFLINLQPSSINSSSVNSTIHERGSLEDMMLPYIYRFIGFGVGSFISSFVAISCWQLAAERQINTIRKRFFHAIMRQEIGWFDVNEVGGISSRFSEDISKISDGMGDKMAVFIQWLTTWASAYVMAFTRSWKLTLAVIIVSPLVMFIGSAVLRLMRGMASREAKAYAKAGAVAEQALRAIKTVQAFQGQENEIVK